MANYKYTIEITGDYGDCEIKISENNAVSISSPGDHVQDTWRVEKKLPAILDIINYMRSNRWSKVEIKRKT